jgi:hypothetical protein
VFRVRASRRVVVVAATVAVLLVVLVAARHVIARSVLQTVLSSATGYDVRIGSQAIGTHHAALFDVHVVKNGDPVLDAQRVDVEYALRDIFPGGQHRFGFAAVSIQKPVLTITRHADGTLTFNRTGGTSGAPPTATRKAAAPYYFTARVRDGVIRLVDAAPLQPDLANQTIENVSIDASVKSDARTTARVDGVLLGRRAPGAPVTRYPLAERTVIDVQRGIALNRITARELPLRGALGFLIHAKSFRFDDGVLDDVDAQYFALAPKAGMEFAYRLGGHADLRGGRIAVGALAHDVRDLNAPLVITDDMLAAKTIGGTLAGVPVHGRGALYDLFGTPSFRIALAANDDLRRLRTLFAFSADLPLSGAARLQTLLESSLSQPLIHTWLGAARIAYGKYPIDGVTGYVDYYDNAVAIDAVRARYGAADLLVGGRALFADAGNDFNFALNARGPGASIPYTDVLAPDAGVIATALISAPPKEPFRARGTIATVGATSGSGTFAVDPRGVGEFGPFNFGRADGSSLAGGFELQRPISQSAGWLHARNFKLAQVRNAAALPGASIPGLPPLSGTIDGDLAGGGTPDSFGLAGALRGRDLRVASFAIGSGSVRLEGALSDVRLADIAVDGPLGRFSGNGAYADGLFALDGTYDGALERLAQFTSDPSARGEVHGPVRATIAQNHIVVQTTGAAIAGGRVRGVAVDDVAGTIAVDNGKSLRVVAVDGSIGGSRAVAADAGGGFLVSAPALPVAALRGAGLPLQAGTLSLFGQADLRGTAGPSFDGVVALSDGMAAGYPISGGADVSLAAGSAQIRSGVAALGRTYGNFTGRVDNIGGNSGNALAYDLAANVPIGDVGEVRSALRVPVKYLDGSFSANVRVRGNGARPRVAGDVAVPEGSYNGLAFHAARAAVAMTPSSLSAQNGVVTVGSTHAQVAAALSVANRAFAVDVRSADANLADFNDYFDEAETLDGRGSVALAFANDGRTTRTTGRVDVTGLRYRRFTFGATAATWSQHGGAVDGALNVRGAHGTLRANGTMVAAAGDPLRAFERATYRANVQAQRVDLGTWLPPFGITAPVLGQVDARGSVAGRWPRLAVNGDASLANGSMFGYAVRDGHLHAASDGSRIALSNTVLDLGFARFDATGSFGLATSDPLALSIHGQTPDVAKALATVFPKGPRYDVGGALQATATIAGSFAKPRATAGFELTNARYTTLAIPRVLGNVSYDGKTLLVNEAQATFAKGTAAVLAGAVRRERRGAAVVHARAGRRRSRAVRTVRPRPADQARWHPQRPRGDRRHAARAARDRQRRARERHVRVRARPRRDHQRERAARVRRHERRAAGAARERRRRNARRERPARPAVPRRAHRQLRDLADRARRARGLTAVRPRHDRRHDGVAQRAAAARALGQPHADQRLDPDLVHLPEYQRRRRRGGARRRAAAQPRVRPHGESRQERARAGVVAVHRRRCDRRARAHRDAGVAQARRHADGHTGRRLLHVQPRVSRAERGGELRPGQRRTAVHRLARVRARHQPRPRSDAQHRRQRRHHGDRERSRRRARGGTRLGDHVCVEPAVLARADRRLAAGRVAVRCGQLRPAVERDHAARRARRVQPAAPARRHAVPGRRDQLQRRGVLGAERPADAAVPRAGRTALHGPVRAHGFRAHGRLRRRHRLQRAQADRPPRRVRELRPDAVEPGAIDPGLHRAAQRDDLGPVQLLPAERRPGVHQQRQRHAGDQQHPAAQGHPAHLQPQRIHLLDRAQILTAGCRETAP